MKQHFNARCGLFSQPPQNFYARPEMHILCGGLIQIENCGKITGFSASGLSLCAGNWNIRLYGTKLMIRSLAGHRLIVAGKISRIEFGLLENPKEMPP